MQGKGGRIYEEIQPSEMLRAMNILPDFSYSGNDFFTLDYIHYGKNDLDFYFIRNTTDKWISRNCSFRQKNKVPALWNPVTGDIINAAVSNQDNNCINVPVTLPPFGSIFVVFRPGSLISEYTFIDHEGHPPLFEYQDDGICFWEEGIIELATADKPRTINNHIHSQTLEGAWEVFFPEGWGAPERKIFPKLISWTDSDDEGIKYFSGIATYKKTFQYDINSTAPGQQKIYLDLGNLSNIGEAWLNGKPLGVTWTKPYRFDISDVILPGDNVLVMEIANTWSNRIVGDAVRGEKYTSTNITSTNIKGLNKIQVPWAQVPLIESGLFGPVKIFTLRPVN